MGLKTEAAMTVNELLVWMSTAECLREIEHACGQAEADYRRRWGGASGGLQLADWMVGHPLGEVRGLDTRGDGIEWLLFAWPHWVYPK